MNKLTDFALGVPGIIFDYAGATAPNGFLLCYGQAVSRTTYAALFAVIGVAFGAGDGSTTFNVPDLRGYVAAGVGNMGGTASGRLSLNTTGTTTAASAVITGIPSTSGLTSGMQAIGGALPGGSVILTVDSATQVTLTSGTGVTAATAGAIRFCLIDSHTLGATGGAQSVALTAPQIPAHIHPVFLNDPGHTHTSNAEQQNVNASTGSSGASGLPTSVNATINPNTTGITVRDTAGGAGTANQTAVNAGGGGAHPNLQPTIALNKIIKT